MASTGAQIEVHGRHVRASLPIRFVPARAHAIALRALVSSLVLGVASSALAQQIPTPRPPSVFGDSATFEMLAQAIRRSNPELAARRAALAAAASRFRAAGFAPAAVLSAEIEEIPDGLDVAGSGSARIELSRELLAGPVRAAQRAVELAEVERARIALDATERRVVADAGQLLTRAVVALSIARRLAAEDSLLASADQGVRTRFAVGDARYVDVLRLRTERLRVQTEGAAAITDSRVARNALLALLARPDSMAEAAAIVDSALLRLSTPTSGRAGQLVDRTVLPRAPDVDSLLAMSGAVRMTTARVTRADAARRLAAAEQRPQLSASVGAQRFERDNGGHTVGPTVGVAVSLPFTRSRANRAALEAAEQDLAAARAQRVATIAVTRGELIAARDRYEAVRERLSLYDAALLRGARDEREAALASYRGGDLSLLELLDFERALARAEIAQLQGRADAADAFFDLIGGAFTAGDQP